jgi:hypothetical protein
MATVVKNFRIKSGLIVEGTTGTINGQNILTETGGDSYILNLVGGATLVKSVDTGVFNVDNAGNLTINNNTFDAYGSASSAQDAAATDATNKANQALADAQTYANGLASNYDAAGSASAAQTAAQSYADGLAVNYDSAGSASSAEQAAKTYADGLVSGEVTDRNNAIDQAINSEVTNRNSAIATAKGEANDYTDTAVSNLVGLAPQALDTLEELATALENNPDIIANLESVAAGKQDALTAGSNIDITGTTISVTGLDSEDISDFNTAALSATSAAYDAAGAAAAAQTAAEGFATTAANNAQSAAEDYADGLAGNYEASGNVESAVNNLVDGTTQFTEVSIGWMTDEVAAYVNASTDAQVTAYSWNKYKGASAKFIVRMRNGIHSQVSEILLTRDNSDNIAITEYGIVTTNGILGDITASVNGSDIELKVTPEHNTGTEIIVSGTLMSYGD